MPFRDCRGRACIWLGVVGGAMGWVAGRGARTNAVRPSDPRALHGAPERRNGRGYQLLGLITAITAFIAVGAKAAPVDDSSGFQQTNSAPVLATTTVTGVSTAHLSISTVALGDVISVDTPGYTASDSQASSGPVNAGAVLNTTNASGDANLNSEAGGNLEQITAPQGGIVQVSQSTAAPENAAAPAISAGVQIGANDPVGADTFGGATMISASAFGDLFSDLAVSGQIATTANGLTQSNASPVAATIDLNASVFSGPLTATGSAIGNEIDLDHGSDGPSPGSIGALASNQNNAGAQTATVAVTNSQTLTSGNALLAIAMGNVLNAGDLVGDASLVQTNSALQTATTTLQSATLNGSFGAQAIGNQVIVANNGSIAVHQENDSSQSATVLGSAGLVLNAATTFQAIALGNNFSGSIAPGQVSGAGQQVNSGIQTAAVTLDGVTAIGDSPVTLNAVAIGNMATLSAPNSGFVQANYNGGLIAQTATVTITNSTFSSGVSISTTAQGNLITIKH
jgi:hypothetical protein